MGAKAELKQCVTQAGYEVDAGGKLFRRSPQERHHLTWVCIIETFKNEKLEISDWAAASEQSSTSEDDTGTDESESE